MIDNSDLNQKLEVRKLGISLFKEHSKIVDLFAGEGLISKNLWAKLSNDLTCIEKDKIKFDKLDFCLKINGNSSDYVHLTEFADIVDCDAYGLVFNIVLKVINYSKKDKIIFFTESNPFHRGNILKVVEDIKKLPKVKAFNVFKSNSSSVFYGFLII